MASEQTLIEGFNVRIVRTGDAYGRDDCLTHEKESPLVEFYDAKQNTHAFGPRGQFVSRYYCSTILGMPNDRGLALDGDVPAWSVSAKGMAEVKDFLRERLFSKDAPDSVKYADVQIAKVLRSIISRVSLNGVKAITEAYAACWDEQNSGNKGSQMQAQDKMDDIILKEIAEMLDHDKKVLSSLIFSALNN